MLQPPKIPLALLSGIRVINLKTSSRQAHAWQEELETLYSRYFKDPSPTWTWNDMHDLDRDAMVELEEIIRAGIKPPVSTDLVCSFLTPDWRKPYWKQLFAQRADIADLRQATIADIPETERALWIETKVIRSPDGQLTDSEKEDLLRDWKAAQTSYATMVREKIDGKELVSIDGQRFEWNATFSAYWSIDGYPRQLTKELVDKYPLEDGQAVGQGAENTEDLGQWYVCPVVKKGGHTKEAPLDRTQAFLVRSNMAEIVLTIAKSAQPTYEFSGEVVPYAEYVPGLSKAGQVEDFRRWVGLQNSPTSLPLGTVVAMD